MDSFNQTTEFMYNPNINTLHDAVEDSEFSGILEIYVHHARNIHNICIYDNQDVYAKFSLTYNPDETLTTRVINGGGKNPDFNENLIMKITQLDAVLKCEIWMLSRARNYLEDQLLGFALVPVSLVSGKGKVTQDFSLSSTDLFHSPAGTVKLSLSLLSTSIPHNSSLPDTNQNSSISSEVVLLDRKVSDIILDPVEFSRIEFPDINVVTENQKMVSQYFNLGCRPCLVGPASFLHLGACPQPVDDYEMVCNSSEGNRGGSVSPDGQNSTTTSLSDDRNSSANSIDKNTRLAGEKLNSLATEANQTFNVSPDTPTSKTGKDINHGKNQIYPKKDEEVKSEAKFGQVFPAPLGNINLEAEQSAMQKQIVDMYMRSMQQFTESLAKMKLPMDIGKPEGEDGGEVIQNHGNKIDTDKKKDGSRVFYGSRAFF